MEEHILTPDSWGLGDEEIEPVTASHSELGPEWLCIKYGETEIDMHRDEIAALYALSINVETGRWDDLPDIIRIYDPVELDTTPQSGRM